MTSDNNTPQIIVCQGKNGSHIKQVFDCADSLRVLCVLRG